MGKPGPKPKGKVKIEWSPNFAYAIGLLATDGNLSPDGRHISFTSKDIEQVNNFKTALGLSNIIGRKARMATEKKEYFVIQFSGVSFYEFLQSLGIHPNKSKTLGKISIQSEYFFDFLRGCFDGDGSSYSYWDKRWKSSFLFYLSFCSASPIHLQWLRKEIFSRLCIKGHITSSLQSSCYQLKYAKNEARKLVAEIYKGSEILFLSRKRLKIEASLAIMDQLSIQAVRDIDTRHARVAKLADALP